ncbi:hypothetical protein ABIE27_003070 [Paenibacillus sp. 4624]|jgi:hypothetical protein|uniref:SMI1/KNR4 family protein n=1 Tax=Paenibacillus amylolyticus TaxID=1451 RepID=A0A5M9WN60_PAEAM|nr:SMI1/KNR4 family protein [Paenibacillus amylolyticus]KAA8783016.1 SMI1/KNR4 family protein [Paenibacillus amylolyticus]
MKASELEPIRELLVQAYGTTMGQGSKPETEQDIESFEQKYQVKLPAVYRALLLEFGACNFGDPALFSAKELDWAYPEFLDAYREYEKEYDLPSGLKLFPIGGFGEGSIAVLDETSGKVLMLIHDDASDLPLREIEPDFYRLMMLLAESAIWVEKQMK